MGRKTRNYSRVTEADQMILDLQAKYAEVFWAVNPKTVIIMGIDNVDRTEKAVEKNPLWSKLVNIKGVEKAIMSENGIPLRYAIEVFWSDWNTWRDSIKLAVIARHLLEITPEVEKKNRPDAHGFKILYKALGINWEHDDGNGIPNLILSDVKFDLDLLPGLDDVGEEEDDLIEDANKPSKRSKSSKVEEEVLEDEAAF